MMATLRRDVAGLPEGPGKAAIMQEVARQEKAFGPIEKILEVQRIRDRKDRILKYGLILPLAIGMGYFPIRGLIEGKVRNLLGDLDQFDGRRASFPASQYPYTYWAEDPALFVFLVFFYSLIAFIFFAVAFDVVYFGRRRTRTREEYDFELEAARRELAEPDARRVSLKAFGFDTHGLRISPILAGIVIAGFLGLIAYKALEIYLS